MSDIREVGCEVPGMVCYTLNWGGTCETGRDLDTLRTVFLVPFPLLNRKPLRRKHEYKRILENIQLDWAPHEHPMTTPTISQSTLPLHT